MQCVRGAFRVSAISIGGRQRIRTVRAIELKRSLRFELVSGQTANIAFVHLELSTSQSSSVLVDFLPSHGTSLGGFFLAALQVNNAGSGENASGVVHGRRGARDSSASENRSIAIPHELVSVIIFDDQLSTLVDNQVQTTLSEGEGLGLATVRSHRGNARDSQILKRVHKSGGLRGGQGSVAQPGPLVQGITLGLVVVTSSSEGIIHCLTGDQTLQLNASVAIRHILGELNVLEHAQVSLQVSGVNRLGVELVCIRGVDCDSRAGDVGLSRVGGGGAERHATKQGGRSSDTREKLPQLHEKPSLPYCD